MNGGTRINFFDRLSRLDIDPEIMQGLCGRTPARPVPTSVDKSKRVDTPVKSPEVETSPVKQVKTKATPSPELIESIKDELLVRLRSEIDQQVELAVEAKFKEMNERSNEASTGQVDLELLDLNPESDLEEDGELGQSYIEEISGPLALLTQ